MEIVSPHSLPLCLFPRHQMEKITHTHARAMIMLSCAIRLSSSISSKDRLEDGVVGFSLETTDHPFLFHLLYPSPPSISSPPSPFSPSPSLSQVFEGYGQTECTAGATLTLPGDCTAGHVGPPICNNYVKLVDVPDMNYFAQNGEGEVHSIAVGA